MKRISIFLALVIVIMANLFVGCGSLPQEDKKTGIQAVLDGKYISIFGDSISTFEGISNSTMQNKTLGVNRSHYYGSHGGVKDKTETWWWMLTEELQVNLLINNSSSGSKVYGVGNVSKSEVDQGIGERANNLHATRGDLAGTNPDIIIIFMGINDLNDGKECVNFSTIDKDKLVTASEDGYEYASPSNFTEGYFIMTHKIVNNYRDAKVFIINLPSREENASSRLLEYNDTIKSVSDYFCCTLVDLFSSKISGKDYFSYAPYDHLHPDKNGMAIISETVKNAIEKEYLN